MIVADYKIKFDHDIFLRTDYPVALDSPDHINPWGGTQEDYTDGSEFARLLLKLYPEKKTLIDLGTATGWAPLTMREVGMLAVGLEGSDVSRKKGYGAWKTMPGIVRTCDISRPFYIVDRDNDPITFDYVISFAVIEHVHPERMETVWENIERLMNDQSLGIFAIDLGTNIFHLSGGVSPSEWRCQIANHFEILDDMIFDENGCYKDYPYCRPSQGERERAARDGYRWDGGRTFWWVRKAIKN